MLPYKKGPDMVQSILTVRQWFHVTCMCQVGRLFAHNPEVPSGPSPGTSQ